MYETMIRSGLLYGSETRRLMENSKRKLETVKLDSLGEWARISRLEWVRNEEVEKQMGVEGTIIDDTERKQLVWHGYVERMNDNILKKAMK